jgi:hypothetical protein
MTFPPPVQLVTAGATSGTGKTFGAGDGWEAPLAGNGILVIAACADRLADLTTPEGYSSMGENSANGCPVIAGFGKVSDGTETEILVEWSRADQWVVVVSEIDMQDVSMAYVEGRNGDEDNNTDTLSCLTSDTIQGFLIAAFASNEQNGEQPSYTNDFVHQLSVLAGGSSDLVLDLAVGSANADSPGTYETTATWTSSTGRTSRRIRAVIAVIDGEHKTDAQRSNTYQILNRYGETAYVDGPGSGTPLTGLNRGQARKHLASMAGYFNVKKESV